jgi:hypothetical protein
MAGGFSRRNMMDRRPLAPLAGSERALTENC